jgi:hypothetical protein
MATSHPDSQSTQAPSRVATALRRPLQAVAFWVAILIPLSYPALLFGGMAASELLLLAALVAANAVALVLGREHRADADHATL